MSNTDAREQRAGTATAGQAASGGSAQAAASAWAGEQAADGGYRRRRGHRGRLLAAGAAAALVAAATGAVVTGAFGRSGGQGPQFSAGNDRTGIWTVTRQSLTSQTEEDATLADAGSWTVAVPQSSSPSGSSSSSGSPAPSGSSGSSSSSGTGTFTWLPRVGRTLHQGQAIYKVSGSPVVLLYGDVPAYRSLSEGMTGADVTELNSDLVTLGYATRAALGPRSGWDYYSAQTAYAVGQLQARLGLTETGTLSLGQAVFLPGPALITGWGSSAELSGPATPGTLVVTASSTTPQVTIDLDAGLQSEVKTGDPVSITLPDGTTTPGVISQISRVASASSSGSSTGSGVQGSNGSSGASGSPGGSGSSGTTITVLASLSRPKAAGKLNQAPVTVTITTGHVRNALTVPVDALLAQAGGGYAVEVTGPGGDRLVKVTPGLFDDAAGLVQVTGNVTPGQHVVVPGV